MGTNDRRDTGAATGAATGTSSNRNRKGLNGPFGKWATVPGASYT